MEREVHGYPSPTTPSKKHFDCPPGAMTIRRNVNLNAFIPTDALMAGYELREIVTDWEDEDPWYLYDKDGHIVKEWLNKPPSQGEVFEACSGLV